MTDEKALDVQVGGDHYKTMTIQPVEFIEKNRLPFWVGNVIKYICRCNMKGGIEDLRKAVHYCDLAKGIMEDQIEEMIAVRSCSTGGDCE